MTPGEITHHVINGILGLVLLLLCVLTMYYYFLPAKKRVQERYEWETERAEFYRGRKRFVDTLHAAERASILAHVNDNYTFN